MAAGSARYSRRLTLVALAIVAVGGAMLSIGSLAAAATKTPSLTLAIVSSTNGSCETSAPICSGLAGGDEIAVSGAGFTKNETASMLECNDDPSQPVLYYLGNWIPVSCTKLDLTTTSKSGTFGPTDFTLVTGTTGPPALGIVPQCTEGSTTSSTTTSIPDCTTSGNSGTDAANFP